MYSGMSCKENFFDLVHFDVRSMLSKSMGGALSLLLKISEDKFIFIYWKVKVIPLLHETSCICYYLDR